jgi:hypothetical protein
VVLVAVAMHCFYFLTIEIFAGSAVTSDSALLIALGWFSRLLLSPCAPFYIGAAQFLEYFFSKRKISFACSGRYWCIDFFCRQF